jgi:hypothetical protein
MNVQRFNRLLEDNPDASLHVMFPSGIFVPDHFHITEIGRVHKEFIDCGGTHRETLSCALQLWVANDKDHRVNTTKLRQIMDAGSSLLDDDMPIMVEYGDETISQFPLSDVEVTPKGLLLVLGAKPTECLAPEKCGVSDCGCGTSGCC